MVIMNFASILANAVELCLLASLFLLVSKLLFFGLDETNGFGFRAAFVKPAFINTGFLSSAFGRNSFGKRIAPEKISLSRQKTCKRPRL